jgi:hypothetical protein
MSTNIISNDKKFEKTINKKTTKRNNRVKI